MRNTQLLAASFVALSLVLGGCASNLSGDTYSRDEARKAILDSIQAQGDAIGVGNPDATALITAISQFIETPGQTLVIKLTPRAKAPALQLMQLLNTDPQSALAQFKIEASTGL